MAWASVRLLAFMVVGLASAAGAEGLPPEVRGQSGGIGTQFTTADGRTLYVYDKDTKPGESACLAKCAEAWPPLLAADDAQPAGEWSLVSRPEGKRQWAYRGRPLYAYAQDKHPGATLGDGLQEIWHIAVDLAPRPRAVVFQGTVVGRVAANVRGRTLYAADHDCTGTCLQNWLPFAAPWAAHAVGDWSTVTRKDDRGTQWAFRGKPVYTFAGDARAGERGGEAADKAFHAIVLQPTPAAPSWVTLHHTDYGPVFADAKGMTLYAIGNDMADVKRAFCDDACMDANWTPVVATGDAKPSGNWGLTDTPKGRQWTYRGQPVFLYKGDAAPGEINGDRFAVGNGFGGFHVLQQKTLIEETL